MTDTIAEHADPTLHQGEPLIELSDVGKSYGNIRALQRHQPDGPRRRGHLRPRRQRRRQVHPDQDHLRAAPAQRGHPRRRRGGRLLHPARGPGPRHRHGLPGPGRRPLMPVWRNFFLGSEMTSGGVPARRPEIREMKRIADEELRKMGIVLRTSTSPSAPCPAASASASPSPGPSTSAPGSSSWTSPPPPSASSSPASC